ncbi:HmuY protein [Dyadobacter koreensis]|uniref:HmuY protein n=1 Tax=Dyadobacter koreensis TaxID=408657 RepID=A0A1H6Z428_9BACT|nr:HmuY family protein [Dyadobacter koreensis]SEJ46157.1 HmuY protein [Dyadobacter koreensis]
MKRLIKPLLIFAILGIFNACSDDDPPLPDNLAGFESTAQGFEGESADLKINLGRAAESAVSISVALTPSLLTYGTQFTTEPAATNNAIALTVPAGQTSVTIKVLKKTGVLLNGDESILFKIASVSSPAMIGTNAELKLSFKAIVSDGTQLQLNGIAGAEAGASAANSVYLDLSANTQTPVLRDSWDLGFNSGADFRVILNNTNGATAIEINKSDINAVSDKDIDINTLAVGQGAGTFALYDGVSGDLTKTVIKEISATDADNKVYVVNRAGGSGSVLAVDKIYKVRVLRKGTGYTLQYAKLNETTFKTLDVTKDVTYNFQFASLEKGAAVSVEPTKARWDIVWGYSLYFTGTTPYSFSDLVFINHHAGVTAAEILTSTTSYDAFAESNLSAVTFLADRDVIGSKWRVTSGGTVGVKTDRFYLIKDAAGNVYKLRFLSFHANDGGERGKPKLEYKLVKKGA